MLELTQKQIDELNKLSPDYESGIYKEPYGIDTFEKRYVLYHRQNTGGYSGGSCWDDSNPRPYEVDYNDEFPILDIFLEKYAPNVTYLEYKKIQKLIQDNNETEYEYYGNRTDYRVRWIVLEDLINLLKL